MGKHAAIDDLFGHTPQRDELFREPMPVTGPVVHTPDTIRTLAGGILAEARGAASLPWDAIKLRAHTAMFPYYAEWLPEAEGKQLLLDLKTELDRLEAPVEEMGPNWQRLWGLAA